MIKKNELGIVLLLALLPLLLLPIMKLTGLVIYANQDSSMQVETNQTLFYYENFTIYANLIGPGAAASTFNCTYNASNLVYGNMTFDGLRFFATNSFPTGILGTVTMDVNCSNATGYLNISTIPYTIVKDSSLTVSTSLPYGVKGYNITFYAWYNETDRSGNNLGKISGADCNLSIDGYGYRMDENGNSYYLTLSNLTREINKKYNVTCNSNNKYNITYSNNVTIYYILETNSSLTHNNYVKCANFFLNLSINEYLNYLIYDVNGTPETGTLQYYNLTNKMLSGYSKLANIVGSLTMTFADMDNDAKYEIIYANSSSIWKIEVDNELSPATPVNSIGTVSSITFGHFTNFNKNEIAVIDGTDLKVKIMNSSYDMFHNTSITADDSAWKITSCKFGSNLTSDLLLYKENQASAYKLYYLTKTTSDVFIQNTINTPQYMKITCDYFSNKDYMDIIIRTNSDFIVYKNQGGFFTATENISIAGITDAVARGSSIAVSDLNKDGYNDIVYTGQNAAGAILFNGSSLINYQNFSEKYVQSCISAYDYDDDNDPDLFLVGKNGVVFYHTIVQNNINLIDSTAKNPLGTFTYTNNGGLFSFSITNLTNYGETYSLGIGSTNLQNSYFSQMIPMSTSITAANSIATPIRYVGNLGRKKEFNLTLPTDSDLYFNLYAVSPLNKVHFLQQLHYTPIGCSMFNYTAWDVRSSCDINSSSIPTVIKIANGSTLNINSDTYYELVNDLEIHNNGTLIITKNMHSNGTIYVYNYPNSTLKIVDSKVNLSYMDCDNCSINITKSKVNGIIHFLGTNSSMTDCVLENITMDMANLTLNNCSYNRATYSDSLLIQNWWISFYNNSNVLVNISFGDTNYFYNTVSSGNRVLLENLSYVIKLSKPLSESVTNIITLNNNMYYDLALSPGYPEFTLNPYTTNFSNYSIEQLANLYGFTIGNSNSSITFLSNVDVRGKNFTALVNNFYNNVFVNDTFYNSNAQIAIRNLPYIKMPVISRNGSLCGDCNVISYNSGVLNFSVGGFSTYQAGANSGLNVSTYSSRGINIQNIEFEVRVDYKNISTLEPVHNADCDLYIDGYSYRANESNRTGQYYVYKVNLSSGTHLYIANCSSDAAENQTTSGTITVYPEGNYLIGKNVTSLTSHGIFVYNNEMYDVDTTNANGIKYNFTTESQSVLTIPKDKRIYYDSNNDGKIDLSEVMIIS
jgi:hypothetical protein